MRRRLTSISLLLHLQLLVFIRATDASSLDTVTATQSMKDGDTVVSRGGIFEMGFFSPPANSGNRYVGIWYKKISPQTVVWVANRDAPVTNASVPAQLKLNDTGILILLDGSNHIVWTSGSVSRSLDGGDLVAKLLDSGNLVVGDENNPVWQSFDYLTDTLLPGMKFGRDFVTGKEWFLSSWKSGEDPAPGNYTWRCDTHGYPQNILRRGSEVVFRGGPWNGVAFSGGAALHSNPNLMFDYNMFMNKDAIYYVYTLKNKSLASRFVLTLGGTLERLVWEESKNEWSQPFKLPKDDCDQFSICGPYGSCNISSAPRCGCLDSTRFIPKKGSDWESGDWSGGCERRRPLNCANGTTDVFLKYSQIKLPDTRGAVGNATMNFKECSEVCLKNCTCMAYTHLDVRNGGSGCLLWFGDLIDTRAYPDGAAGQDIHVRMVFSELDPVPRKGPNVKVIVSMIVLGVALIVLILALFLHLRRMKNARQRDRGRSRPDYELSNKSQRRDEDLELPLFDLATIHNATASFSEKNKLGEGGFGPVYKGVLEDGQEVAVKRLSKTSVQGIDEFKNEVICISKLQHRNLVRLLGCCIQGEETLLIYEFMPNKSLDFFIFDKMQSSLLDWPKRFNIITGIARGLLYLHQDSRLRIIHRDLKASNVLLDYEMNPKISDFGIARSFGGNQTQASTDRVVGTFGYMSPEYTVDGIFSTKSDVFSFGVLVLEIVSGKRNRGFVHQDHHNNLLGHVWRLYNEDRSLELIDGTVTESCHFPEVMRAIQVGLLCVQESPEDRPSMLTVVFMLGNESALPPPKHPGFFTARKLTGTEYSSSTGATTSVCEFTNTVLDGR